MTSIISNAMRFRAAFRRARSRIKDPVDFLDLIYIPDPHALSGLNAEQNIEISFSDGSRALFDTKKVNVTVLRSKQ